jgi:hypothetical protein
MLKNSEKYFPQWHSVHNKCHVKPPGTESELLRREQIPVALTVVRHAAAAIIIIIIIIIILYF